VADERVACDDAERTLGRRPSARDRLDIGLLQTHLFHELHAAAGSPVLYERGDPALAIGWSGIDKAPPTGWLAGSVPAQ
jgi:hypothetical protein